MPNQSTDGHGAPLVRDRMRPHPSIVTGRTVIATALHQMRERHVGFLPVVDTLSSQRLIGIITDRDIALRCVAMGHAPGRCLVEDHMTKGPILTAFVEADLERTARLMESTGYRRVPVLDESKRVIGLLALTDVRGPRPRVARTHPPTALVPLLQARRALMPVTRGARHP